MAKADLVIIPSPGIGHFVSATEFAKCLLDRDERLSITIVIICPPDRPDIDGHIRSIVASYTRVRCLTLPPVFVQSSSMSIEKFLSDYIEAHKPHVEHAIMTELLSDDSVRLARIVVDLFWSSMVDVAHKFKVPSYLFFPSAAASLGFLLYLPVHHSRVGCEYDHSVSESMVPSFSNPVPTNV